MWRFKDIFMLEQTDNCKKLQIIFEQYFVRLWRTIPEQLSSCYFQGITDVFELVFASQLNRNSLDLALEIVQENSE